MIKLTEIPATSNSNSGPMNGVGFQASQSVMSLEPPGKLGGPNGSSILMHGKGEVLPLPACRIKESRLVKNNYQGKDIPRSAMRRR